MERHEGLRDSNPAQPSQPSQISRRSLLKGAAVIGISGAASSSLLSACGGSNSAPPTTTTTGSSGTTTAATAATTSASSTSAATPTSGPSAAVGTPKSGGTLAWGFGGSIFTLDPHVSSSRYDYDVEMELFDQLAIRDETGTPTPFLASKWTVSGDGLQYTFTLRSDVIFHDGTTFNAAAVKYNFDRMVNPATKSEQAIYNLGPYDHTDATDNTTATVVLKQAFAPLLVGLCEYTMGMVSPTAADKAGANFGQSPVGSGPFKFKEWAKNDHVTIVKNSDYNWAPAIYKHKGPPYLDAIIYRLISEDGTRAAALQSGQVNMIMPTPDVNVASFKSNPNYNVVSTTVQGFPPSLMFNVTKPPTDDVKVRQALSYGIDRSGIIKAVYSGDQTPAAGIWKKNDPYYWNGSSGWYPFDPAKCQQLLDEAGWKANSGGTRTKNGQAMEVVYLTLPGQIQGIAELVQTEFQSYGVKLTIKTEDNPAQQQDAQKGVQNIVWLNWLLADPYGLDTVFGSENVGTGWNFAHFSNSQVDQLLKQGVETNDQAKRVSNYQQIQQVIYDQAAVYPINYLTRNWTLHKAVQGFTVGPDGEWPRLYDTWLNG